MRRDDPGGLGPPSAALDALVAELRLEEARSYGHRLSAASSLRIRQELVRRWGEPRWAPRAFALVFALLCLVISLRAVPGRPRAPREQSYSAALAVDAAGDLDASEPVIGGMNPPAGAIAALNASEPVIGGMNPPAGAIAALNASEPVIGGMNPPAGEESGGPRELP